MCKTGHTYQVWYSCCLTSAACPFCFKVNIGLGVQLPPGWESHLHIAVLLLLTCRSWCISMRGLL